MRSALAAKDKTIEAQDKSMGSLMVGAVEFVCARACNTGFDFGRRNDLDAVGLV